MDPAKMEEQMRSILERNKRVEQDKAWEVSWARRSSIAIATYIVAVLWLFIIGETSIWLKSVVPVGGYILSTLSLPFIKKWWLGNTWKKRHD